MISEHYSSELLENDWKTRGSSRRQISRMSDLTALLLSDPVDIVRQAKAIDDGLRVDSASEGTATETLDRLELFFKNGLDQTRLARSASSSSKAVATTTASCGAGGNGIGVGSSPSHGRSAETRSAPSSEPDMPAITPDHEGGGVFEQKEAFACNIDRDNNSLDGSVLTIPENLFASADSTDVKEDFVEFERPKLRNNVKDNAMDDLTVTEEVEGNDANCSRNTNSGPRFRVGDEVIVIELWGQYEATVRDVRPSTGRRLRSRYEYLVQFKDWPGEWDKWRPESDLLVRDAVSLAQVYFTKKTATITPFSKTTAASVSSEGTRRRKTVIGENGRGACQRRSGKRKRRDSGTGSRNRRAAKAAAKVSKRAASQESTMPRSVGRTRAEMNQLDRSNELERLKRKTGIFAKFGMSTVATKGGKVSHLVMNDEWNVLASTRSEIQELYLGTGIGRERCGNLLAAVGERGIPLFHAPKVAENTTKIHYVGHWAPIQADTKYFRKPKTVMGEQRQMLVRLRYVNYDRTIDRIMTSGAL